MLAGAHAILESSLRDGSPPSLTTLDRLRKARLSQVSALVDDSDRSTILAGMLMARSRTNAQAALELADFVCESELHLLADTVPADTLIGLEAAIAEVYLTQGHSGRALLHADRMVASLTADTSDPWRSRLLSIAAAAHALEGHHRLAEHHLLQLEQLSAQRGWPARVEPLQAIAEAVVAFTTLDVERLEALGPKAQALLGDDARYSTLVRGIEALTLLLRGDHHRAAAVCEQVGRVSHDPSAPSLVRECALGVQAMAFVLRGTPARAVMLLRDVPSPPGHLMCLGAVRASAFLALGDARAALRATDECVQTRAHHSLLTLPASLLRRAVAHHLLGYRTDAVHDALDALALVDDVVPSLHLLGIPEPDLLGLARLLMEHDPSLAPRLGRIGAALVRVPAFVPPVVLLPALSPRERVIAHQMRSDLSYPQIAAELHVALSTVKSQAHSIVRKLAVESRASAVTRLEVGGFYDLHPAKRPEWTRLS